MKVVTPRTSVDVSQSGVEVRPDAAWIPVSIRVTAETPTRALASAQSRAEAIAAAVEGDATLRLQGYEGAEEQVGGKSRIRAGARHVARVTGIVRVPFAPGDDYLVRVARLERVRERLGGVEDVVVSMATYVVEDPEQHRAAVLDQIAARLNAECSAFGLEIAELDTAVELSVSVNGPARARVSLDVRARLRRPGD